jgi:hypothetical protein
MTTTEEAAGLRATVTHQDIPIATFSDDEFEALWAGERLEVDPEAAPRMASGLRGLVAHEYASVLSDGSVQLSGEAALVRHSRTANLGTVLLRLPDDGDRQWILLEPGVLLEQRRPAPGALEFVIRDVRRAVRELAEEVLPAGTGEGEEWSFGPDEEPQRWIELLARHPQRTRCGVVRPVAGSDDWVAQRLEMLTDGTAPGWLAMTRFDGRTTVLPARRATVRRLLGELLDGTGLEVTVPSAP